MYSFFRKLRQVFTKKNKYGINNKNIKEGEELIEKILLDDHARMKLSVYGKVMTLWPGEYSLDHVRENLDFYFSSTRFKKSYVIYKMI